MPLSGDAKRAYQKDYMARKRASEKASGNTVLTPGTYEPGHIHNWSRKYNEDTATCHGCQEVVKWEGKMLNIHTDGLPPTSELINDMDQHKIDKILNSPAINTNKRAQ